jgi:hypothetical protein
MELIHKIFAAFLQAAQPVDFQRKYSTYLHALAPFNVNRAMRAEAPSMMVRHVRFVAGASSDSNYPRSPPHHHVQGAAVPTGCPSPSRITNIHRGRLAV